MIFFITFLRMLAACLITNAHYTGIYPTDIIANGGLIGDVLFFAVSGYCLFNVKKNFPRWYLKRLVRVYLPVLVITALYSIFGFYTVSSGKDFLWWFVYPTGYHFVASIVLLYIPFYFIGKYKWLRERLGWIIGIVAIVYLLYYLVFFDKSYYHIDNVREHAIRFLFFESMLLGAYFKKNEEKYRNNFKWWVVLLTVALFAVYFASKLFFSKYAEYSYLQIFNQIAIFALLHFTFWLFASIDGKLEKLPKIIKSVINLIAEITLEIYVVQLVLIDLIRPHLLFPLNWLVITVSIFVVALVLHYACSFIQKGINVCVRKISTAIKNKKEEKVK